MVLSGTRGSGQLLEPIGNIPPRELEEMYYSNLEKPAEVAGLKQISLR
jgi:hypothetical protein